MRVSIMAVVVALGLAALGCGGDSKSNGTSTGGQSNSGGTSSGGTSSGDREQFLSQICDEYMDCCKAAGRPSDGSQCRAFYGAFAPAGAIDAAAASACLAEVRASGDKKCESGASDTPSCGKVFASTGTAKPGEACDQDRDCAPADAGKVVCESAYVNGASIQQCQVQMVGKLGSSPCIGTINGNITFPVSGDTVAASGYTCDVADGLACDEDTGACVALAKIGEACTNGFYQCVKDGYCSAGMCKAKSAAGFPCDYDSACAEGTYCATDTKTCKATLADGAACTTSTECASDDCTNGKCAASSNLTLTFLCGTN